jgi:hypothetical protein
VALSMYFPTFFESKFLSGNRANMKM